MSGDAHSPRIAGQKRPRVDNELHHDPDLWLSDGNIVLTTKDDEGKLWGFRCHKSLLSRHSTVFNDMFTLNQPADAELHEGLPVVTLTDSYADMKALLHVLFDPVEYLAKPSKVPQLCHQRELSALSGPLRLSHKYDFAVLHANLVKVLESQWPTDLPGWTTSAMSMRDTRLWRAVGPLVNLPSLILLADEAGVPSILPAAWYDLHVEYGRSNLTTFSSTTLDNFKDLENGVDLASFPPAYHVRLNRGSRALQSAALEILGHGLPAMFSRAGTECKKAVKKWLERQLLAYSLNEKLLYDPLLAFQHIRVAVTNLPSLDGSKELEYPICYDCQAKLVSALHVCQQYIWDMIPHFFGIEALVEDKDYGYAQYLDEIFT